jgi:hypothetical protein
VSYYSSAAATVYVHLRGNVASAVYDFDTVTSLDSATVDNTSSLYVCGTSAVRSASQWFGHRLFNRAKTVAENLGMFVNGMAAADVGASQSTALSANFAAGLDGWTNTNNTNSFGVTKDGRTNCMESTCSSTTSPRWYRPIADLGLTGKKKIQVTIPIYIDPTSSGNRVDVSLAIGTSAGATIVSTVAITGITKGQWNDYNVELDNSAGTATVVRVQRGAGVAVSDLWWLSSIGTLAVGITSELLAQNAQTDNGQVLDSSGNKQHAKLAEAGMSTQGAISARRREVRWTNTWAGTNELQYIGGVNQAILPSNAYIESIVGTVSGATPHDIIVGDGSDTDRYVTITTGLAAGTTSFTVASRTTDGTNLKLTVDPDTDATMSIAWVITYYRLET